MAYNNILSTDDFSVTGMDLVLAASNSASTTHASTTEASHESSGLPQLDPTSYANQGFYLIISLIAIYLIMLRALPNIGSVLEGRASQMQRDLDRAADAKAKAEEAQIKYEQALTDARAHAQEIAANSKAEFQAELDKAIHTADTKISAQKEESAKRISEMKDSSDKIVADIAIDITQNVVNAVLPAAAKDQEQIKNAVTKALEA